jgi:PilZ domain
MPQIERRRWERLPITIPFFIRWIDPSGREFLEFSAALNLSASGVLLASRHDFYCGATVDLEIPSPIRPPQLSRARRLFQARILRSVPSRHYYLLGLQFVTPLLPDTPLDAIVDATSSA